MLVHGIFYRFRWVFCQLEMLQNCLPQNVRRVLRELPNSLDETYERMLREVGRVNPDQAYRLLQCLAVATRPLGVDELAEVLALDFDGAEEGIPALKNNWRWDDRQQGVLSTCSSLIVVVNRQYFCLKTCTVQWTRVVQFAHFSVKEFLTSDRLANLKADISRFHIRLRPAHTIMAQSCFAILLQSNHEDAPKSGSPLSDYAARRWVDHAKFENVSLHVEHGMRQLFDPAKPYFTTWLKLHNIDRQWRNLERSQGRIDHSPTSTSSSEDNAALCLYYAALSGFHDLTKHLIAEYPQHVNARVGLNKSPLAAALCNRHIQIAELLYQHGAVLPIGYYGRTLLHVASENGRMDVAQWLLNAGADANAQEEDHNTPLHVAVANGHLELIRTLLGHGVDVNAVARYDVTPLHTALEYGHVDIAQLLIQNGADVHARDEDHWTPLHLASYRKKAEIVKILILYGADINARNESQRTPLHVASFSGAAEAARLLIEHGVEFEERDERQRMPLHLASYNGRAEVVRLLIQLGADVNAQEKSQSTPLHLVSSVPVLSLCDTVTVVHLLIEHGAGVNMYDRNHKTPLHRLASSSEPNALSLRLLLENGADVDVEDDEGLTPYQIAWSRGLGKIAQMLSGRRASVMSNE